MVRDGLVQVRKGTSALLAVADILNWDELCKALRTESAVGPAILRLMSEKAQTLVRSDAAPASFSDENRLELVYGLNEAIKNRQLAQAPEMKKPGLAFAYSRAWCLIPEEEELTRH